MNKSALIPGHNLPHLSNLLTGERSGFVNQTDSVVTVNEETRTLSIAPAVTAFEFFCGNVYFRKVAAESVVWTDVEGVHYVYYNSNGVLTHTATYAEVFELDPGEVTPAQRREAKVINYGIIYGMGAVRLSRELGISRSKASEYIDRYFERYPGVGRFYESKLTEARTHGYVSTMFGRRRYLPDITSDHGGHRQAAERVATNTPIQGSTADIIKRAMVALDRALRTRELATTLILQIHDELLLEAPTGEVDEATALVREVMEGAAELAVPILVDVGTGRNWAEAH